MKLVAGIDNPYERQTVSINLNPGEVKSHVMDKVDRGVARINCTDGAISLKIKFDDTLIEKLDIPDPFIRDVIIGIGDFVLRDQTNIIEITATNYEGAKYEIDFISWNE